MTRNALFLLPLVLLFLAFVPRSEGMVFNKHGENVRNKLVVLTKTVCCFFFSMFFLHILFVL